MRQALLLGNPQDDALFQPDLCAKARLPQIFGETEVLQAEIFKEISAFIDNFEQSANKTQLKFSQKKRSTYMPNLPCSLFILESEDEHFRYFLTPRRHDYDKKLINYLGKGNSGLVIPAYELIKDQDNKWHLAPESPPKIAIKVMRSNSDPDKLSEMRKEIKDELEMAKICYSGTGITVFPKPHDRMVDSKKYRHYVAMDYLPGESGKSFVDKYPIAIDNIAQAKISENLKKKYRLELLLEALNYSIQTNQLIEEAHKKELYLGDVKPENMILNQGRVSLIDFGLTKKIAEAKQFESRQGSAPYIAPEILIKPPQYSFKADDYSKGLVIYGFLGGHITSHRNLPIFDRTQGIKPLPIDPRTEKLAHKGAKRIKDSLLEDQPISAEAKTAIKEVLRKSVSINPHERPTAAEIDSVLKQAEQEAREKLEIVKRKIQETKLEDEKQEKRENHLYSGLEQLKNELEKVNSIDIPKKPEQMTAEENKNDILNFYFWLINKSGFQTTSEAETSKRIITRLCGILKIQEKPSLDENILEINKKIAEKNSKSQFVTHWQFHNMLENYNNYKDKTAFGLSWLRQSTPSAKAIRAANQAKTPTERYNVLMKKYFNKESIPSCCFFGKPKQNSKRAFGQAISKIRQAAL